MPVCKLLIINLLDCCRWLQRSIPIHKVHGGWHSFLVASLMSIAEIIIPRKTTESPIERLKVSVFSIPMEKAESDGTLEWKATTMILVQLYAAGKEGIGYTYGDKAISQVIANLLRPAVINRDAMDVPATQRSMVNAIRNNGQCGIGMMAVSAVDIAGWDLKAKLLDLPLCRLLGQEHEAMKIYGSGGFTSYTDLEMQQQLEGWLRRGIGAVKIKVGRNKDADEHRVAIARKAIGEKTELYVDANGAYTVSEALQYARRFSAYGVDWLEEPVPATWTEQMRFIRQQLNGEMRLVAGEYGYTLADFRSLLESGAVDVIQADATRCGGITDWLKAGQLCEAFHVPLSSHCAPAAHLHAALSLSSFSIGEYFHDHVVAERNLFEGAALPRNGHLFPDLNTAGLGLTLKEKAENWRVV
jgi:L-alanine-DL-glutamate epimerase-like enolase superfamily enzyme